MTAKEIKDYLITNYGECRHDAGRMETAIRLTAKEFDIDSKDLFHFIVENQPMTGTHSYGFHTTYGRLVMNNFESAYRVYYNGNEG